MSRREQLQELHLALEGAVDQMGRAQRIALAGPHGVEDLEPRIDRSFAEIVAIRNAVREVLMKVLSAPPPLPTLRKKIE